jgi:hypothetical protein
VKYEAQFNDHPIIIEAIGLFISTNASALAFAQGTLFYGQLPLH